MFVETSANSVMFPLIVDPDFVTEFVTRTVMTGGSGPSGGGALLPGAVVNVQANGSTLTA